MRTFTVDRLKDIERLSYMPDPYGVDGCLNRIIHNLDSYGFHQDESYKSKSYFKFMCSDNSQNIFLNKDYTRLKVGRTLREARGRSHLIGKLRICYTMMTG